MNTCIHNICIHYFDTDHSQDLSWPATLNGMLDLAQALGLPSSRGSNPKSPRASNTGISARVPCCTSMTQGPRPYFCSSEHREGKHRHF
jgi:hypothetical protein